MSTQENVFPSESEMVGRPKKVIMINRRASSDTYWCLLINVSASRTNCHLPNVLILDLNDSPDAIRCLCAAAVMEWSLFNGVKARMCGNHQRERKKKGFHSSPHTSQSIEQTKTTCRGSRRRKHKLNEWCVHVQWLLSIFPFIELLISLW